ncbi:hypothetical protein [Saccharopolyspora gregorii]|uniref:hypothetical protein n=1 Tax=Saccharopolyspora gregorii TaxID=33914 RepID=UPI0021AD2F81|nr:hypothetical protein [Saccharopolyspora gregorii]
MRPRGVRLRVEELRGRDQERDRAEPGRARGRALAWFVHGCALIDLDVTTSSVVELYREVLALLDDPSQHRTGSGWERAVLHCVDLLREPLAEVAADPHRHASRDERLALAPLVEIPRQVLVGPDDAERSFPMACWNAAGALLDGVLSPYRAVGFVVCVGYFSQDQDLTWVREWQVRYEDEPDARPALDAEIRAWARDRVVGRD